MNAIAAATRRTEKREVIGVFKSLTGVNVVLGGECPIRGLISNSETLGRPHPGDFLFISFWTAEDPECPSDEPSAGLYRVEGSGCSGGLVLRLLSDPRFCMSMEDFSTRLPGSLDSFPEGSVCCIQVDFTWSGDVT